MRRFCRYLYKTRLPESRQKIFANMFSSSKTMKCGFKIKGTVTDNFNITLNEQDSAVALWNEYEILLYENLQLEQPAVTIIPDFTIHKINLTRNYLLCIDCSRNLHSIPIRFKTSAHKRLKAGFNPRESNVIAFCTDNDYVYSLKQELTSLTLCLNKIKDDFTFYKTVCLLFGDATMPSNIQINKCMMKLHLIKESYMTHVHEVFKSTVKESQVLIVSVDGLTVYGALINPKTVDEEIKLRKLYQSPLKICDIGFIENNNFNIVIGLECGSFSILTFDKVSLDAKIIHMNISLHAFCTFKESILYTDGRTLWKADYICSQQPELTQLHFKHIKDCVIDKSGQVLATTYTNNIYQFCLEDATCYYTRECSDKKDNVTYYPANDLINNSDHVQKIMEEVNKNKDLIKNMEIESNFLLTLAIAKNDKLRKELITYNLVMYDTFQDIQNVKELILTRELKDYFQDNILLFLIIISPPNSHQIIKLLNSLKDKLKLHITFSANNFNLETTTVAITDFSNFTNILIPLPNNNYTKLKVEFKLIAIIDGGLNGSIKLPIIISEKVFYLNSECFIKNTTANKNLSISHLRLNQNIEDLILKLSEKYHGNLFTVLNNTKQDLNLRKFSFYVKLPDNFVSRLRKMDYLSLLSKEKSDFIYNKLLAVDFLNGTNDIVFQIGDKKLILKICIDESQAVLKISSVDIPLAWNIRMFFANIFYGQPEDRLSTKMLIHQGHYTVIENIQRKVRQCLDEGMLGEEDVLTISHEIQEHVVGLLPL